MLVDDDIAQVDADAELDPLFDRLIEVPLGDTTLHVGRELDGVDGALHLRQHAVSLRTHDAPAIVVGLVSKQLDAGRGLPVRSLLVVADQAAVALHVGIEDRREPSWQLDFTLGLHGPSAAAVVLGSARRMSQSRAAAAQHRVPLVGSIAVTLSSSAPHKRQHPHNT